MCYIANTVNDIVHLVHACQVQSSYRFGKHVTQPSKCHKISNIKIELLAQDRIKMALAMHSYVLSPSREVREGLA